MFTTLLESRSLRERRRGGALVSILVHTAIVAAVTAGTMSGRTMPVPEPPAPAVIYVPAPVAPVARASAPAPSPAPAMPSAPLPASVALPLIPALAAVAPIGIPAPDVPLTPIGGGVAVHGVLGAGTPGSTSGGPARPGHGALYRFDAVERVAALRPGNPTPRYPDQLVRAGIPGRVVARFVVDTLGRVEPGSVQLLASTHPAFSDAVSAVLPRYRFTPAQVGGRPVRMLAELPFDFALGR